MSVLLDEETVVLDALDFEIECNRGEHPAEVVVQCRTCNAGAPICTPHLIAARKRVERFIAENGAHRLTCVGCGASADTFDELVEVVPL